jgi:hypothetical protein
MTGITDLGELLRSMRPELRGEPYVVAVVPADRASQIVAAARIDEAEGTTVIVRQAEADALGLHYDHVAAWITLTVHSSLDAVGLTAAVATALASAGISANVLAAFHHDHVLVPWSRRDDAMSALAALSARS